MYSAFALRTMHAVLATGLVILLIDVPRVEAASVRQLVEVVDFGAASVSPDGRLVAFRTEQASVERNTYDSVWYVQAIDGGAPPRRLGEGGPPLRDSGGLSIREPAIWSPDGRWILYRAVLDGRIGVWRAAVDGSRTEPVTDDAANVRAFALTSDGAALMYSVGAMRDDVIAAELLEYDRGVHIDRTVALGDAVFRSGYHEGRLATQRLVDNELERFPLLSRAPDRWSAINLRTRIRMELPAGQAPAKALAPSDLSLDFRGASRLEEDHSGGRIAVLTERRERQGMESATAVELAVLSSRSARRSVRCTVSACTGKSITSIAWRRGSDEVIFTLTDPATGFAQSIYRWNVVTGAVEPVAKSNGELGGGGRWDPGACAGSIDALLCVSAEANRPPRLERIDLLSGQRTVLFDPNAALARDLADATPVELLSWMDPAGTRFNGQFYPVVGTSGPPPPLFIVYYRCSGFLRGGMGDEWPFATLAGNGIAVLCINAASSGNDAIARYEQGRASVQSAIDLLASRGAIDRTRVGMGGLSFGAEVSMWITMQSPLLRAISLSTPVMSPTVRLLYGLWGEVHYARMARFWQLGSPEETPARWRQISPAFNIERVRAPVLMQMSEQEYRSSLDYAVPLVRADRADVYVFPNEPHQKFQPRHKLAVYERNLDWFRFWLLDKEEGNPAKANEYLRWREMRLRHAGEDAR